MIVGSCNISGFSAFDMVVMRKVSNASVGLLRAALTPLPAVEL